LDAAGDRPTCRRSRTPSRAFPPGKGERWGATIDPPPSDPSALEEAADGWEYSGTLYLWAAGINAKTPDGAEIDVDFDTLLDNLDVAFMGATEARRGPWWVVADALYLSVGADKGATVGVPVAPGSSV
jgi:hypothetical protein